MITVENLVYEYPTKRALHGIDLEIGRGRITALVGPNGAGKTTLIRCLVALHAPFDGRVLFEGTDVHEYPRETHRRVGYLPDFYGLYDELTVRQCLWYVAASQGLEDATAPGRIETAAERLEIADRLDDKAATLSRGLRQRLAVAQALVHDPEVLVLDEPASGLDPESRHHLSQLLCRLRDDGMTLIVSSHILAELEDYSDDMVIIQDGRILETRPVSRRDGAARRFRVAVAGDTSKLIEKLKTMPDVEEVEVDESGCRFRYRGDREAQRALLSRLVRSNLPIIEFAEEAERMQDAYIAALRDDRGAKNPS